MLRSSCVYQERRLPRKRRADISVCTVQTHESVPQMTTRWRWLPPNRARLCIRSPSLGRETSSSAIRNRVTWIRIEDLLHYSSLRFGKSLIHYSIFFSDVQPPFLADATAWGVEFFLNSSSISIHIAVVFCFYSRRAFGHSNSLFIPN